MTKNDLPPAYSATAPHTIPPSAGQGAYPPYPPGPMGASPPPGPHPYGPNPGNNSAAPISTHTVVVTSGGVGIGMGPALGNCPSCRIGNVQAEFSCCGICLAIFFFPIGILCCLCMMNRRCSHCGALFG